MEKLKQLILEISPEKTLFFLKALFCTVLVSFFYLLLVISLTSSKFETMLYIRYGLITISGVFAILTTIILLIIKFKVTAFSKRSNRIILLHAQSGKTEIYERPEWKKIPYSIINFSHNWRKMIATGKRLDISFFIEKNINRKIGENYFSYMVYLPVAIKLYFKECLTISDLEIMVQDGNKKKLKRIALNFEEYIKKTFLSLNSDPNNAEIIYATADDWLAGKCSQVFLSKTAERLHSFPDKLFSSIEKTEMKIGLADSQINPLMNTPNPFLTSQFNAFAYTL